MSDFKLVQLLNPFTINSNINPTGVYSPSTSYGPGDSVSYGNASYLCIAATTGNDPTNTTYWQLLASASTNKLTTTARNNSGATIPKGSVVYFSGASGNLPTLALAQANSEATSSRTVGITATAITNNSNGEVVVMGLAESLDTSAFTVGQPLWLSATVPGGLTNTEPLAPNHSVFIGITTRSQPTQGTIEVNPRNGYKVEELHNVAINSLANNQVIRYESASQLWKNHTLVKADVGLGNVDDTTDLDKPISTATQAALDLITDVNWTGDYNNGVTYTVGQGVMFNGASFRMIAAIGAAGYNPVAYPGNWLQVTDYVSPNDIGLGNVNNTADIDKIISTDTQDALDLKIDLAAIGSPLGVAGLDAGGKVPVAQLPNSIMEYKGAYNALTNTPTLVDGTGNTGDVYKTSVAGPGVNSLDFVLGDYAVYNGTTWEKVHSGADAVISVNGYAGVVVLTKSDVGLSNVSNLAPADLPVSTAQQTAIDAKVANNLTASTTVAPSKTAVNTALALKVNKSGDTMTGSLTVTGNNGVEFPGIMVNNTNTAGYCAINARADDGEVIQIAALNSGGAANAYGMWTANQFGLYSKRTLNIMTDTAGAEIKFATDTGATEVAKIDATGKFSSNGMSLNSGTLENVPVPTTGTDATNKDYVDSKSIVNALIFG